MKKIPLTLTLLFGALLLATLPAAARIHYRTGVFFGSVYRPWGWYGPYYGPYPVAVYPNAGHLKIDTKVKDAKVYINGAYAGTVKEVKSLWLRQGTYEVEVRGPGGEKFDTKVFVASGKTIHLRPDLGEGGKS
jgi:hypothetical protein